MRRARAVIDRVKTDGAAWLGGTVWYGRPAMRTSVSNFVDDAGRSAGAGGYRWLAA
jgi:hypothetical protein